MSGNANFHMVRENGWRSGLSNLLRREISDWFAVRRLLVQYVLWIGIINGMVALTLFTMKTQAQVAGAELLSVGVEVFGAVASMGTAIAAIIMSQDAVIGERNRGTAAWILSKPVSRASFIISKLLGNLLGVLATAIIVQGVIAYFEITVLSGQPMSFGRMLGAIGLVAMNMLFYMTLTIMLGTLFRKRGAVLGIPMVIIFGHQAILGFAPWMMRITPWNTPGLVKTLILAGQVDILPVAMTAVWCVLFTAVGIWRFNSEDLG